MLTTSFVTGSVNWADLGTPDIEGANTFYAGLFGWAAQSAGEDFGGYVTYRSGGKSVAGGMAVPADQGTPAWSVYFRTPDVDATAKSVEQAGGTVVFDPMDVGDLGRMAIFTDSAGASFGAWQPGTMKGFETVNDANTLTWVELYTDDVPAAAAFYSAVFGLQTADVSFPGGTYTSAHPANTGEDAMFGGLVPKGSDPLEAQGGAYWLPYFGVDDCDATVAKAKQAGASVRMEPFSAAGVGRFAKLADPYGAKFGVIKGDPNQT
ncbi:VOC family protein [Streptomyces sp. NBC_01304]|uniref:VOC family protein n=1 Tax=Streptomyces sp. NBC_01304 TaxID=2903818 RepID=UPI002E131916|nr:VOC family protein [Streptomyces sp. NBC_01304]